jgi:PAS domain S-box-containing protein
VHPDDFAGVAVRWADLLEGKTALYESVLRLRSTDGGWRWVRSTARVTEYDEAGKPTRITGSYIDVTEQYESERALRESQERLDLAITGGALAVWDSDCVALTTIQDSRFAEFVKRPLVGKMADWDWMQYVHPDDYPRLRANAKAHVRGESESYECEFRILDGHGHWRWLRSRGRVVERADDGTALRAVGTYVDFTDQMRASEALAASEADLSAIFESAGMGIILLSPEMEVLRSNALAKRNSSRIFGMPIEDMRSIVDQLPGSAGEWLERAVAEVIQAGEGRRVETDILAKGGPIPYEFDFAPIRMADGSLRGVGLFSRDISKRKADEALLQQSQKLDSLGRMVAGIAHDFNNLLSAILGYSELAAASLPEGSSARVDIDEAVNAARSASDLTRQLLAFARKQHTEPRDVDINDVLTRTERLVARLMGDDVKVTYARAETPLFVHIDPGQFEQVIVNLAVNARDAMPTGGELLIQTRRIDIDDHAAEANPDIRPGDYVAIEVTDTGVGMDEATQARAFEPFFTTKGEGKGTGLGLASIYGIAKAAGGHVTLLSQPGKGTTITVCLPVHEPDRTEA